MQRFLAGQRALAGIARLAAIAAAAAATQEAASSRGVYRDERDRERNEGQMDDVAGAFHGGRNSGFAKPKDHAKLGFAAAGRQFAGPLFRW
jgi:hypothetical protein